MKLKIGSEAPNFSLQNTSGDTITLADYDETVVLLFFPLAFSSVCTEELCKVRDNMKLYNELKTKVIAISVDSFYTLRAFKKAQNLNFTLASDFNREASEKYSVLNPDFFGMHGVSRRAVFVISPQKKLKHFEILDNAGQMPDFSAIQKALLQGH